MTELWIYGCSDDLIEIEGDIKEEFNIGKEYGYLLFSDGTAWLWNYDGNWRFSLRAEGNLSHKWWRFNAAAESVWPDGYSHSHDYSDLLYLNGDIEWVAAASNFLEL